MPATPLNLRRNGKRERVADAIREHIRAGHLQPGDRLAAVRAFAREFACANTLVLDVLNQLVAAGALVKEQRAFRVRPAAPEAPGSRAHADDPHHDRTGAHSQLLGLYPQSSRRTITVSLMDSFPEYVELWRRMFDRYAAARSPALTIRIVPYQSWPAHTSPEGVDLIQSTSWDFHMKFPDWAISDCRPELIGRTAGDYLDPLRRFMATPARALPGFPFAVTLTCLYVNQDLLSLARRRRPPDTFDEYLDMEKAFRGRRATAPCCGAWPLHILTLLQHGGGLRLNESGLIDLDLRRCRDLLTQAAALSRSPAGRLETLRGHSTFREGRGAFLLSYGCMLRSMRTALGKTLGLAPTPLNAEATHKMELTILGINRRSPHTQECLELCRFLCSDDVAVRFRRLGALPAIAALAEEASFLNKGPFSREVVTRELTRSSPHWNCHPPNIRFLMDVTDCGAAFFEGRTDLETTLERLALAHRLSLAQEDGSRTGQTRATDPGRHSHVA